MSPPTVSGGDTEGVSVETAPSVDISPPPVVTFTTTVLKLRLQFNPAIAATHTSGLFPRR